MSGPTDRHVRALIVRCEDRLYHGGERVSGDARDVSPVRLREEELIFHDVWAAVLHIVQPRLRADLAGPPGDHLEALQVRCPEHGLIRVEDDLDHGLGRPGDVYSSTDGGRHSAVAI